MLHWLPTAPDRKIIYNDRAGDRFVSVVMDVFSGEKRVLSRPVAGLTNDGRKAFSLNYAAHAPVPPVVGYAGVDDPKIDVPHPEDDGLFLLDLETGESELLVSFAQAFELNPDPDLAPPLDVVQPHHREHRRHAGVVARLLQPRGRTAPGGAHVGFLGRRPGRQRPDLPDPLLPRLTPRLAGSGEAPGMDRPGGGGRALLPVQRGDAAVGGDSAGGDHRRRPLQLRPATALGCSSTPTSTRNGCRRCSSGTGSSAG